MTNTTHSRARAAAFVRSGQCSRKRLGEHRVAATPALSLLCATLLTVVLGASAAHANDFYVAPNGFATNPGTLAAPIDLVTALSSQSPAQPDDTLWLRGGIYAGSFTSNLTGTFRHEITVRQYPGERATLDGSPTPGLSTLTVYGAYTIYRDFEVMNGDAERRDGVRSRGTGINVFGPYTKFINLTVHDAEVGIGFWTPAIGAELYGNVVYNNGDEGPDRGHGHSIYTQNDTGTKRIADNVLLDSFSFGIHAYTQGGAINNMLIDGNIAFNHGMLSAVSGAKGNILLGGTQVSHNSTITNNLTYYPAGYGGRGADIGYITACDSPDVEGNYFVGDTAVNLDCTNFTFLNNSLVGAWNPGNLNTTNPVNTYSATHPSGLKVFVRPNEYQPGRANVAVYNWDKLPQVNVDLSGARLTLNQNYELRNAQNFFGPPVTTFTYTGAPVQIPMTPGALTMPVGNYAAAPLDTRPEFGAFIVMQRVTTFDGNLFVSPTAAEQGEHVTLNWWTTNATSVSIDHGIGTVAPNGTITLTASATTTYTLTATSTSGSTLTRTTTLTVAPNPAPTIVLTSPAAGVAYPAPANLTVVADVTDSHGVVTKVDFYLGSTPLGTVTTAPYTWPLTNLAPGGYTLTAVATNADNVSTTSAPVTFSVVSPTSTTAIALFVRTDTTTSGTWKSTYGTDGYAIATDSQSYPSYAQVAFSNQSSWIWAGVTPTTRGLQRPSDSTRLAATWFTTTSFDIDVNLVDGATHQIALYGLDFDNLGRQEAVYIIDFVTNTVLDSRMLSGFSNGHYWIWQLKGHVVIRVARIAGPNAAVSAIFFGTPNVVDPPTVTVSSPAASVSPTAPATIELDANVSAAAGRSISQVNFYAGSSFLGTGTGGSPYTFIWTSVAAGIYGITAVATDNAGATTTSAPISITVSPGATGNPTSSATFMQSDSATQGAWRSPYGHDGFAVFSSRISYPSYAQVGLAGSSAWIWSGFTSDARALQKPDSPSDRIAATIYSAGAFSIDLNLIDGLQHQVALYAMDWDSLGRQETIDVLDASTGTVLSTRSLANFGNGQFLVWRIQGHVTFRITRLAGSNAVLSGVFFDGAGGVAPPAAPTVTVGTSTSLPFVAPATITLNAAVSAGVTQVTFYDGALSLASVSSPFTYVWSGVAAGTHNVTAIAQDSIGQTGSSNTLALTVNPPATSGATASAGFITSDASTKGFWSGVYGRDGNAIASRTPHYPSYAQVTLAGQQTWIWSGATTDARGLQTAFGATDRVASTWFSTNSFTIDVNLTDGASHQVALYGVDWDSLARQQTIDILDASSGSLLDSQIMSGFSNGQYLVWRLTGHVSIRVTRTGGPNAALSAIFFDPALTGTPPTIHLTSPDPTTSVTAPATVTVAADVQDVDAAIMQVILYAGTTAVGRVTAPPYEVSWNVGLPGQYTLTAVATNSVGQTTTSAPLTVIIGGSGSTPTTAFFVKTDTTTQGTWKNAYGAQGYSLASDATSGTAVQLAMSGQSSWIWGFSSDVRALQRATFNDRMAATWFSGTSLTIDVTVTDGLSHAVALYMIDWDSSGRSQTVQLLDAATANVLDTQVVSSFAGGRYYVWRVTGHVTIRVTRGGGPNAVVSGVLIDP